MEPCVDSQRLNCIQLYRHNRLVRLQCPGSHREFPPRHRRATRASHHAYCMQSTLATLLHRVLKMAVPRQAVVTQQGVGIGGSQPQRCYLCSRETDNFNQFPSLKNQLSASASNNSDNWISFFAAMAHSDQPLMVLKNYWVLDEPLEEDKIDKLLGRVVLQKVYPLQGYSPDLSVTAPQKLVPELMGNKGTIMEMKSSTMQNETNQGLLKVASLLSAKAQASHGLSASLEAATLSSYQMTQIPDNVAKLNKIPAWVKPVKELFKKSDDHPSSLPIITKVLVAENITINYEVDAEREVEGSATVPLATAASHGVISKGPGDVTVGGGQKKTAKVQNSKTIQGRVVVALAYSEAHYQPVAAEHGVSILKQLRKLFRNRRDYEIVVKSSTKKPIYYDNKGVESAESDDSVEEEKNNILNNQSDATGRRS
jgi:hypothetical protein